LQGGHLVHGEEGVINLAEGELASLQLLLDEAVAVEIAGGLEQEEGRHPHHDPGLSSPPHRATGLI